VNVFALSDEVVRTIAELRPMTATFWGVAGHDAEWDDLSPAGHEQVLAALRSFAGRVPTGLVDPWERLAARVLDEFLRLEIDRLEQGDPYVDLNHLASPAQYLRMAFDVMDSHGEQAWLARIRRLEQMGEALVGYRRSLARGLAEGRPVAARQVRSVVQQARVQAGERSSFRALPEDLTGPLRARLVAAIEPACAAWGELADWLEREYLPHARVEDGVGRERYLREARRFLGMELDPEETYAWGWQEIARLDEQMRAAASAVAPGLPVPAVLAQLGTDPRWCAHGVEAFLETMRARQAHALASLDGTHFELSDPVRRLDVKLAPPGGPPGAYYTPPSEDFARPGCVWYSLGEGPLYPLFDQVATAYHEGFPGHHLQIGTQYSLTDRLSRLHRVMDGSAGYAEGWALYTEQLMAELGFYEEPAWLLGMLSAQMIRACRVVIDIGMHLSLPLPSGEPWTFDRGVEMLVTQGGMDAPHAASEMTRYLGWPGQAISYKVGQRVILELREQARGQGMELREFHRRVLGYGNVGLDHLRELMISPA
jgi:uncharacterized protein (DUF885 family)